MGDTLPKLTLRELAREYAGGRIDRQTFRSRRAQLLEKMAAEKSTSGKSEQQSIRPEPEVSLEKTEIKHSRTPLIAGVTIVIILLAVAVLMLIKPISPPSQQEVIKGISPPYEAQVTPPAQTKTDVTPSSIETIMSFVREGNWSLESRKALLEWWNSLDSFEQHKIRTSSWFLILKSELNTLIEEERGLTGGKSSPTITSLAEFGKSLGLDLSIEEPPLPPLIPETPKAAENRIEPQAIAVKPDTSAPNDFQVETKPDPGQQNVKQVEIVSPDTHPEETDSPSPQLIDDKQNNQTPAIQPDSTTQDKSVKPVAEDTLNASIPTNNPKNSDSTEISETKKTMTNIGPDIPDEENCRPYNSAHKTPKCRDPLDNGGKGPLMRLLPAGVFTMGSDQLPNESPRHDVKIEYPFAISSYEVTQAEFQSYCDDTGQSCPEQPWPDGSLPVVNVSQEDAKNYAKWLSTRSGRGYRLPTEAEWEYAARAGSSAPYPLPEADLGTYAHYSRHGSETQPIPRSPQRTNPNKFGLFHMAGNIREWVLDDWSDNYRNAPNNGSPVKRSGEQRGVIRGGSYADDAQDLRSSARNSLVKNQRDRLTGFRLVRDIYLKSEKAHLTTWGAWWLKHQRNSNLTIRLLSGITLDEIEKLIKAHPNISLNVLDTGSKGLDVYYGLYTNKESAINGYNDLPKPLQFSAGKYQILSIETLQQSFQ